MASTSTLSPPSSSEEKEFYTGESVRTYCGHAVAIDRVDILQNHILPRLEILATELNSTRTGLSTSTGSEAANPSNLDGCSIYTGKAGLYFALQHVYRVLPKLHSFPNFNFMEMTQRLNLPANVAEVETHLEEKLISQYKGVPRSTSTKMTSIFLGEPGFQVIGGIARSPDPRKDGKKKSSNDKKIPPLSMGIFPHPDDQKSSAAVVDELLFGRSGFLASVAILREYGSLKLESKEAHQVLSSVKSAVAMIIQHGREGAAKFNQEVPGAGRWPLMWTWYGEAYLGAAHGVVGILYHLLPYLDLLPNEGDVAAIVETLRKLVQIVDDFGHLPILAPTTTLKSNESSPAMDSQVDVLHHWCHGIPGFIPLLATAHKVFGPTFGFLSAAERYAEILKKEGLLRKGLGLCHGVFGNAYSFLSLYRGTLNQKYLFYSQEFLRISSTEGYKASTQTYPDPQRKVQGIPDKPTSLMEGSAGELCFLVDLLRPESSFFPGYEFPNEGMISLRDSIWKMRRIQMPVPPSIGQHSSLQYGLNSELEKKTLPRQILYGERYVALPQLFDESFCKNFIETVKSNDAQYHESIKKGAEFDRCYRFASGGLEIRAAHNECKFQSEPVGQDFLIDKSGQSSYHVDQVKYAPLLNHLVGLAQSVSDDVLFRAMMSPSEEGGDGGDPMLEDIAVSTGGAGGSASALGAALLNLKPKTSASPAAAESDTDVATPDTPQSLPTSLSGATIGTIENQVSSEPDRTRFRIAQDKNRRARRPLRLMHAYCIEFTQENLHSLRAHTDPSDVTLNINLRRDCEGGELLLDDGATTYTHVPGEGILFFGDTLHQTLPVRPKEADSDTSFTSKVKDFFGGGGKTSATAQGGRSTALGSKLPISRVQLVLLMNYQPEFLGEEEGESLVETAFCQSGRPVPARRLNPDILREIACFVKLEDLGRLLRTCRSFNQILDEDDSWQRRYTHTDVLSKFFPASNFAAPPSAVNCCACNKTLVIRKFVDKALTRSYNGQLLTRYCPKCNKYGHAECFIQLGNVCGACRVEEKPGTFTFFNSETFLEDDQSRTTWQAPLWFDFEIGPNGTKFASPDAEKEEEGGACTQEGQQYKLSKSSLEEEKTQDDVRGVIDDDQLSCCLSASSAGLNEETGAMPGPWKKRVQFGLKFAKRFGEEMLQKRNARYEEGMSTSEATTMYTGVMMYTGTSPMDTPLAVPQQNRLYTGTF